MRITTQMLNRSAAKAGVPLQQGNLMNYINNSGNTPRDILNSVNAKQSNTSANRLKYEKQGKIADELYKQIQKLTDNSGMYEVDKDGKENEELYKEAEKFAGQYNSLLTSLGKNPESLDLFYAQSLKDLVADNKDLLAEAGITVDKDGKMTADKNKMKEAGPEKLEKVFGKNSKFLSKLEFVTSRISDRAEANLKSASGNYSQNGNMNFYNSNKYDFRG